MRAFIPWKWATASPLFCTSAGSTSFEIHGGDSRDTAAAPPLRLPSGKTDPDGQQLVLEPYRLSASVLLPPPFRPSSTTLLEREFHAGLSTAFARTSTLADSELDDDDYDNTYGDCYRVHRTGRTDAGRYSYALFSQKADKQILSIALEGGNPLAPVAPPITADVSLTVTASSGSPSDGIVIDGSVSHDCMPAHEIYIDGVEAYSWQPESALADNPVGIVACLSGIGKQSREFRCETSGDSLSCGLVED